MIGKSSFLRDLGVMKEDQCSALYTGPFIKLLLPILVFAGEKTRTLCVSTKYGKIETISSKNFLCFYLVGFGFYQEWDQRCIFEFWKDSESNPLFVENVGEILNFEWISRYHVLSHHRINFNTIWFLSIFWKPLFILWNYNLIRDFTVALYMACKNVVEMDHTEF